jgi:hypothetical protein
MTFRPLFLIVAMAVFTAPQLPAQGFGKIRKHVILHRKLPHAVHLSGSSIAVKVASRDQRGTAAAQQLHDVLETELLKNDARLRVEASKPDVLITCSITSMDVPQPQMVNHTPLMQDQRRAAQGSMSYRYTGTLNVSYQAKDSKGRVLDSDNVSAKYLEEFDQSGEQAAKSWKDKLKKTVDKVGSMVPGKVAGGEAPPDHEQLQRILVERAAAQIAARLVTTDEQVEVNLARGKLDDYNRYAETGLWKDWLENLETMKPFPERADDAYRLYNIGVAYEALAYGAEDLKNARKFFDQAAINYGKALDARPGEKYFLEPQNRIRTAIAHYKRLQEHEAVAGKSSRGRGHDEHDDASESGSKGASSGEGPLTNDQVIRLAKAGLDEDNLIATIKAAPAVKFDFGVDALVKLADNGIKGRVLTTMREKASGSPARRRTTPAAAKSSTPPATK